MYSILKEVFSSRIEVVMSENGVRLVMFGKLSNITRTVAMVQNSFRGLM